ncbi:E3 CR1-gamma1-like protein [Human adenovirus 28]|uniref:E3 CR1-gamma1-like protein n=1 Tax=Human adenovirus 28 TaxID=46930 RepID=C4P227_9ADEN|nr:E3 CR1-gamma1-like protein [Human adenovirus 28]
MKAFTAFVLISLVTLSTTAAAACYQKLNLTRGENITLAGAGLNNTWSVYHHDGQKNGWLPVCSWNDGRYVCKGDSNTITNLTVVANANLTSRKFQSYSYTNDDGYEKTKLCIYEVSIIELPTTRAPTTVRTTRETTTEPTTHPTITTSTTTQLDTTVQNSTVLVRYLLREESTTEQTEATSSAFSSTANLTSLASINETLVPMMLEQDLRGLDMQITFLVVCGIFILVVLLYFVCCKAREKSRRPIYRPVIGEPQPLQVDGGLRNLLFSFTVW